MLPQFGLSFKKADPQELLREIARIVVTLLVLILGCFLIFSSDTFLRGVGSSLMGAVLGYWLK